MRLEHLPCQESIPVDPPLLVNIHIKVQAPRRGFITKRNTKQIEYFPVHPIKLTFAPDNSALACKVSPYLASQSSPANQRAPCLKSSRLNMMVQLLREPTGCVDNR